MVPPLSKPLPALITVGQIATVLGRSRVAVYYRIEKLKLKPALTVPLGALYLSSVVPLIQSSMRRANYNNRRVPTHGV
jgi:hypothetical protein